MRQDASSVIYLDSQASTRVDDRVLQAMLPCFTQYYGNPSSSHHLGLQLSNLVEEKRSEIASFLEVDSSEIFFTSGATEANNLVFDLSADFLKKNGRNKILVSAIEHKSVIDPALRLKEVGFVIEFIPVDSKGRLKIDVLESMIDESVGLVSVMAANNEIGVLQDVRTIGAVCNDNDVLFHCDFVQGVGFVPCFPHSDSIAFATFSAHKMYGPKGIGALFVAGGMKPDFEGMILGGGQERGMRAGTLNLPGIIGLSTALSLQISESKTRNVHLKFLSESFLSRLNARGVIFEINGDLDNRLPGNLNLWFKDVVADELILSLPQLAFSNGSACNSRAISPSHVLTAIGCDRVRAFESIRISFGKDNSLEDVLLAADSISNQILALKKGRD